MSLYVAVNSSLCTGCRECEVVCSLYRHGECNPARSAIRVIRREKEGLVYCVPLLCQQCEDAPCLESCPAGALSRNSERGNILVDEEKCTGCQACLDACPAGCIFLDKDRNVATCCDLCGGEPQCVTLCHSHCLRLASDEEVGNTNRVERLAQMKKKLE